MPPSRLRIDEPGRAGSNGFSVRYPTTLMSVEDVGWKPAHRPNGPQGLMAPHWECKVKLREKTAASKQKLKGDMTGLVWMESNADRKNLKYAHGPDGPFANAAHMFEGLNRNLEFPWGNATSFVTIWANGHTGLRANNEDLRYVVKGRTRDGRWWVTGMFPIAHPKLPRDWDDPHAKSKDDGDYEKDGTRISRFSPESFAPPMSVYDKIIGSLTFPK